jgi:hypothetical protein
VGGRQRFNVERSNVSTICDAGRAGGNSKSEIRNPKFEIQTIVTTIDRLFRHLDAAAGADPATEETRAGYRLGVRPTTSS